MNQESQFSCGHCQGTSRCNCDVCKDHRGGPSTYTGHQDDIASIPANYVPNKSWHFYPCAKCDGTGRIFPENINITQISASEYDNEEHKQYVKRTEMETKRIQAELELTTAKQNLIEAEKKAIEKKIELQILVSEQPHSTPKRWSFFGGFRS